MTLISTSQPIIIHENPPGHSRQSYAKLPGQRIKPLGDLRAYLL